MDGDEKGQDEESPPGSDRSLSASKRSGGADDDKLKSEERAAGVVTGAGSSLVAKDLGYSLYICPYYHEMYESVTRKLNGDDLEKVIKQLKPVGQWSVTETSCGLLASFSTQDDMLRVLKCHLNDELKCPVQVAQFSSQDSKYRQSAIIREVPWAIPLQEISEALHKQGISPVSMERIRQAVKVEMSDVIQYENLLRNGLDFFGVTRFPVISGRWRLMPHSSMYSVDNESQLQDSVLQCYRCQGFWHIAANCRQAPRCVRCGESHSVEFCPRPRQSPICCHCAGPHHAAYRHCPVRQQLVNSTPVSLTLSTMPRNANHTKRTNLPT